MTNERIKDITTGEKANIETLVIIELNASEASLWNVFDGVHFDYQLCDPNPPPPPHHFTVSGTL
jgi:hypothetical protein